MQGPSRSTGSKTRFRLYAQPPFVHGYERTELVEIGPCATPIVGGPRDERMYVVDAAAKLLPYEYPYLPPFLGNTLTGAEPSPDGHFDHLQPGSRAFAGAHLYATVRHVLEIWEGYAARQIPWHFGAGPLELIPLIPWDNAQAGYGFIETGVGEAPDGTRWPFAQSFDVVAHEVGHLILYSLVGLPDELSLTRSFGAFHESAADLTALVSLLHFQCVCERIIEGTGGNLYVENELNRFAELSSSTEVRSLCNDLTMDSLGPDSEVHAASLVLTGAFFDVLVEAYLLRLHQLGAVSAETVARCRRAGEEQREDGELSLVLMRALDRHPTDFVQALVDARDFLGRRLALSWLLLPAPYLTFRRAAGAFLAADEMLSGNRTNWAWLGGNFLWRGIVPVTPRRALPRLAAPPLRRVPGLPEPYELQHSCQLRKRRKTAMSAGKEAVFLT